MRYAAIKIMPFGTKFRLTVDGQVLDQRSWDSYVEASAARMVLFLAENNAKPSRLKYWIEKLYRFESDRCQLRGDGLGSSPELSTLNKFMTECNRLIALETDAHA